MNEPIVRLYLGVKGPLIEAGGHFLALEASAWNWDDLFTNPSLRQRLLDHAIEAIGEASLPGTYRTTPPRERDLRAPIRGQEVWAAGVTYLRSKTARMTEAEEAGGGDFYDRAYTAPRPELFFKATSHRVAGPGQAIRIRRDALWCVPEPELTLALDTAGNIFGYTIGNDVSARDIEGENPLYLPQAKVYDQCCGLGPAIVISPKPPGAETLIRMAILRNDATIFEEAVAFARLKRTVHELAHYLFRDQRFPNGCFLMTGTGIVPPDDFTLEPGDRVQITIDPVGTLENHVVRQHG